MQYTETKPPPRNFRLMVAGQIISIFGAALLRFAMSLYVLDLTGDESLFATIFAVSNIPLLLAPLGGAIADRFNRRNLMVIFDFTSGAIILSFIFLLPALNSSVILIGAVMVLLATISALYAPAVTASVPLLVEEHKLAGANGIVQAVQALSMVTGPVSGGVLYKTLGFNYIIIFSCAAFFISAVIEIFIKIPFVKREQTAHIIPTIAKDLKEGFAYVLTQPFIIKSMLLAALLNLLLSPYFIVGAPIILFKTMQSSESLYGLGMGLINFAAILGALSMGLFAKKLRMKTIYKWLLTIAALILPLALSVTPFMLGTGFYPSYILFIVCAVPIAMIMSILSIFVITNVQKKTPNENLGKVMAIIIAAAQCAAPAGQIIYGVLFKSFSSAVYLPTLFICALMIIISAAAKKILQKEQD